MKIPKGKRLKFEKLDAFCTNEIIKSVLTTGITGYLRFTTEREGLEDYYVFVDGSQVLGAYGEVQEKPLLDGELVLQRALGISQGIIDVCSVQREALQGILMAYPNLRVSSFSLILPEEEVPSEEGQREAPPDPAVVRREELLRKYHLEDPGEEFAEKILSDYHQA